MYVCQQIIYKIANTLFDAVSFFISILFPFTDIFSSMTYSTDKPSVPKKKSIFSKLGRNVHSTLLHCC